MYSTKIFYIARLFLLILAFLTFSCSRKPLANLEKVPRFVSVPANGMSVEPGEIKIKNIPLNQTISISELGGQKLRIRNKDNMPHKFSIAIKTSKETNNNLRKGYEDIPDGSMILIEEKEVWIAGNTTEEVDVHLMIVGKAKYGKKHYQAIMEIKREKNKPADIFVLAVQMRFCFSVVGFE